MKRSISRRLGRLNRNTVPVLSHCDGGTAKQPFTDQFIESDHESPNRWEPKRQSRRGKELIGQGHQSVGRALLWRLVEEPPQEHREVDEIKKTAQCPSYRGLRGIRCARNGILEDLLGAHS